MISFGKSDKGCVRPTNQDAFVTDIQPEGAIIAVCDGMGGANAGNVASRFAIESFAAAVRQRMYPDMDAQARRQALSEAVDQANDTVYRLAIAQPEFRGMGTTVVAALVSGGITLVNVGDSRAYRVNQNGAQRLTADHSYVEEMMRRGKLTLEAARVHPNKNLITRAVGVEPEVESDFYDVELQPNDILLLCSDGLSGMLQDEQIARIVNDAETLEEGAELLIEEAKIAGGQDNITVVLFRIGGAQGEE